MEGVDASRIHLSGNVMVDNLYYEVDKINGAPSTLAASMKQKLPQKYMHDHAPAFERG